MGSGYFIILCSSECRLSHSGCSFWTKEMQSRTGSLAHCPPLQQLQFHPCSGSFSTNKHLHQVRSAHGISHTLSLQRFLLFPEPPSEPDSGTKPQMKPSDHGIWIGLCCGTAALWNEGESGAVDYGQEQSG